MKMDDPKQSRKSQGCGLYQKALAMLPCFPLSMVPTEDPKEALLPVLLLTCSVIRVTDQYKSFSYCFIHTVKYEWRRQVEPMKTGLPRYPGRVSQALGYQWLSMAGHQPRQTPFGAMCILVKDSELAAAFVLALPRSVSISRPHRLLQQICTGWNRKVQTILSPLQN